MAVITDTLEGVIDGAVWFHYDLTADVLYLRLANQRTTPALGEETPDGFTLLRSEADDRVIGLTIINWWARFGDGALPDSLRRLEATIEPWTRRLAA